MAKRNRVVITGMGVISCLGNDVDQFYTRLLKGESGIRMITEFPCEEFTTRFAGTVQGFEPPEAFMDKKQARRVDKCIAYAVCCGKEAILHAGLSLDNSEREKIVDPTRAGVIIGTGIGGMQTFFENSKALIEKGPRRVSPFLIPYILTNMPGALLAEDLGFMGPNYSVSTACATSNHSMIQAAEYIRRGEADIMITGGVEAPVNPLGLAGFSSMKALSTRNEDPVRASRPWDKGRDGFVMGEGAGIFVFESLDFALARGAPILAEYLGGGISCDAHHMTEPRADGKGVSLCINKALQDAGIRSKDVSYINAHATSTPVGDVAELNALKSVFTDPEERKRIVINATKSMIGHALGASGGLEAVAVIQAIRTGKVHPTANLEDPESIDFDVPTVMKEVEVSHAISNSFGFGGHNATIVLSPYIP